MQFLSSNVKTLYLEIQNVNLNICQPSSDIYINATTGLMCWESIENWFRNDFLNSEPPFQYLVQKLLPSFVICGNSNLFTSDCRGFLHLLKWTCCEDEFIYLFNELTNSEKKDALLLTLKITSLFERSLGNLYHSINSKQHCPNMLKTLFETSELHSILGIETIQFLKIFYGPPTSLNVRNIAWHGFLSANDIPWKLLQFLFALVPSIGLKLNCCNFDFSKLSAKPFVDLCSLQILTKKYELFNFESILLCLCQDQLVDLYDIYYTESLSYVVLKWKKEAFADCAILLCPLLEHALRSIYCDVNNLPHCLLTAEDAVCFTTFDTMLKCDLGKEAGKPNKVLQVLGEPFFEMLLDWLAYLEGPRLRDRLSHAEVLPTILQEPLVAHCLFLSLLGLLVGTNASPLAENESLLCWIAQYRPCFHPFALLCDEIVYLSKQLQLDIKVSMVRTLNRTSDRMVNSYANVVRLATKHMCVVLRQMNAFRKGRIDEIGAVRLCSSQQRHNATNFQKACDDIWRGLRHLLHFVVRSYECGLYQEDPDAFSKSKLKQLRLACSFAERLAALTAPSKNRWQEAASESNKWCL